MSASLTMDPSAKATMLTCSLLAVAPSDNATHVEPRPAHGVASSSRSGKVPTTAPLASMMADPSAPVTTRRSPLVVTIPDSMGPMLSCPVDSVSPEDVDIVTISPSTVTSCTGPVTDERGADR